MRLHIPRSPSVAVAICLRFPVLTDAPAWAVTAQWADANIVWGTDDNIVWGTNMNRGWMSASSTSTFRQN